jgi:hypothetical protein
VIGAAAGGQPRVRVLSGATGAVLLDFLAFDAGFRGGVRVGVCDLDRDGVPDIVAGSGPGGDGLVRTFSGVDGSQLGGPLGSLVAYAGGRTVGVTVACADVNGDGVADVVTGATGIRGAPVRALSGLDGSEVLSAPVFDTGPRGGGAFVAP